MSKLALRSIAVAAALFAPFAAQAQHVYQLNGTLADSYGGPSLTSMGGTLTGSGYNFTASKGLSLSGVLNSGTYALGAYTIVFRSQLASPGNNGTDGYGKLVDFKNAMSQGGYYNYGDGSVNNGYGATLQSDYSEFDNADPYSPGSGFQRTTLTRSAAGMFTVYIGSHQQYSFVDTYNDFTFDQTGGIARFFADDGVDTSNDHSVDGTVNYIATYDFEMSAGQVEGYQFDRNVVVATPEPASMVLLATGLVGVFAAARRRRQQS